MMIIDTIRKAIAIGALSLTLAACAADDSASETQDQVSGDAANAETTLSAESLVMAETAWLSITAEGEVFTTYLDGNGRYRDVSDGEVRFGGTWEQNANGELCFSPDQGEGTCWAHRAPGLNGTMRATAPDGRAIEVKKVAYTPPAPAQEAVTEGEEIADGEDTRG